MHRVDERDVQSCLADDMVGRWMDSLGTPEDEDLVCQRWLRQTPPKRFIYRRLYGDLFETGPRLRVLDVGGGLTGLTRVLAGQHDYNLVDLLAHDDEKTAGRMAEATSRPFVLRQDWATVEADHYDIVIANDLFPNVDQRLALFLDAFLPRARRLRLSLTYYDAPRYYLARRIDADEILCMLAWNGEHLRYVLQKYVAHIVEPDFALFDECAPSVYANGRQVCLIEFVGSMGAGGSP